MNIIFMIIGILGSIAATYSAVEAMFNPGTFTVPCYVNMTSGEPLSEEVTFHRESLK